MTCVQCGTVNPEQARFCLNCGTRIVAAAAAQPGEPPVDPPVWGGSLRDAVEQVVAGRMVAEHPRPEPVAARVPEVASAAGAVGEFRLIFVHHDGTDGTSYLLRGEQIDIGRTEGDLRFEDVYLSPRHARITATGEGQLLTALESRNGVFIRLRGGTPLVNGDVLLVGHQVLQFELVPEHERTLRPAVQHGLLQFGSLGEPAWGRLRQLGPTGVSHDVFHFSRDEIVIGREQADLAFTDDPFMSRRHAVLSRRDAQGHLEDLGSSNGTFIRLRRGHLLVRGDVIRMGNVLLRFETT